jgi:hypothetical protein
MPLRSMLDLLYDYRTNVPLYPEWHTYFRRSQPPTLPQPNIAESIASRAVPGANLRYDVGNVPDICSEAAAPVRVASG